MTNQNENNSFNVQNSTQSGQNIYIQANENFGDINVYPQYNEISSADPNMHPQISERKISLKNEIIMQVVKGLLGAVMDIIAFVFKDHDFESSNLIIPFLPWIGIILGTYFMYIAISNLYNFLSNRNKENLFVKIGVHDLLDCIYNGSFGKRYYRYKNGKLYKVLCRPCPICEVKPKGHMIIRRDYQTNRDEWVCVENKEHKLPFDPKQQI